MQQPTAFPTAEQAQALKTLEQELAPLKAIKKPTEAERAKLVELEKRLAELLEQIRTTLVSSKVEPRTMRVLPRGNWLNETGTVVAPGVPGSLPALSSSRARATPARPGPVAGLTTKPAALLE